MGSVAPLFQQANELLASAAVQPSAIVNPMNTDAARIHAERDEPNLALLLEAVANKDRVAFEAFYDATTERVLSLALRITQHIETAEEVVSDVYLQVWRQADRFDSSRGNAFAWLTVLCRSRALDTLRKNNVTPTHGATPISEIPEPEATEYPQDMALAVEEHSAMHAALAALEPGQRQLLALAYFRGYTHSELAEITGQPLGTVKTQLRRTLSKLKKLLLVAEDQNRVTT